MKHAKITLLPQNILTYLLIAILMAACHKGNETLPPYVIPKNKLIPLLVDYHLAQGISNSTAFRQRTQRYPVINLSDSVLAAHGYTHAQFDSTLLYYSRRVDEFNDIYERVITELNRMQAKLAEKKPNATDSSKRHHQTERIKPTRYSN
ncbi:MAG: DUF4296 domain-containing protein [Bacteroidales bacterium]